MAKDKINELINTGNWQFAKTMPEIPHEYIVVNPEHSRRVTEDYPDKADEINKFIAEIQKNGYTKDFYGKQYKYLEIGDYKYWVIENIINRSKIER